MRVTHDLIAQKAGVSRVAVSQVLNKSRSARISPEKRDEILMISRQLGYEPRNFTTHTIGYVLRFDTLGMEFELQILRALQAVLAEHGYRLALITMNEQAPEELRETLNARTVDGAIFSTWPSKNAANIISPDVPFVLVADTAHAPSEIDQVMIDAVQSTQLITQHLIGKGHRRICLLTGLIDISFHRNILKGFYQAFSEAELDHSLASVIKVSDANDIEPLLHQAMQSTLPPTAILGLEFLRTSNAVNYLQSNGYRVPEDVSVASIYNSKEYGWLRPAMTSTSANGRNIALKAADRLLHKIENPQTAHSKLVIPSELIERASVVAPPSN